jgi:hypothetical protein
VNKVFPVPVAPHPKTFTPAFVSVGFLNKLIRFPPYI